MKQKTFRQLRLRLSGTRGNIESEQSGFTLVEILVSLALVSILLLSTAVVVSSSATINAKTSLAVDASEVAFQKLQDYVNMSYDNIPIGLVGANYEVEDFSGAPEVEKFSNVEAKVYVTPESVVDSGTTTNTTDYSESATADTSFSAGSEISATGTRDPTNCCRLVTHPATHPSATTTCYFLVNPVIHLGLIQ